MDFPYLVERRNNTKYCPSKKLNPALIHFNLSIQIILIIIIIIIGHNEILDVKIPLTLRSGPVE